MSIATKIIELRQLIDKLNTYRKAYYVDNESLVSDKTYDDLFDKLSIMEKELGVYYPDSPTQSVGYEVVSELKEVTHNHPMLSLDKTKDINDLGTFVKDKSFVIMPKMDGLTCTIRYIDGVIESAETRGNGITGEDVTHNIKIVGNVPQTIPTTIDEVIVDGEIVMTNKQFKYINDNLPVGVKKFATPRNLAAGSIRQFDSEVCKNRKVRFVAWKLLNHPNCTSFNVRLEWLRNIGFEVVPVYYFDKFDYNRVEETIKKIQQWAEDVDYKIDGCVIGFNDIPYGDSLGRTEHHFNNQIAFKFYDELYPTTLRAVDWTMGKTGALTPTAIFDEVDIDGTMVSRASMHNLSVMRELGARIGATIEVFKANEIIPQIDNCKDDGIDDILIPKICPDCGKPTEVKRENKSDILYCTNVDCPGKLLKQLCSFVSKNGMDIEGLSTATLEMLIDRGWVRHLSDIYELFNRRDWWISLPGWGVDSVDKILTSIEKSRFVNVVNFVTAINIPNISKGSAKTLCNHFDNDWFFLRNALNGYYDFSDIEGFGRKTSDQIHEWWFDHAQEINRLTSYLSFKVPKVIEKPSTSFAGKKFCITGTFEQPRKIIQEQLEQLGGVFVSGVSKNLDYLFAGDSAGSKLDKAVNLGIKIIWSQEYNDFIKNLREE